MSTNSPHTPLAVRLSLPVWQWLLLFGLLSNFIANLYLGRAEGGGIVVLQAMGALGASMALAASAWLSFTTSLVISQGSVGYRFRSRHRMVPTSDIRSIEWRRQAGYLVATLRWQGKPLGIHTMYLPWFKRRRVIMELHSLLAHVPQPGWCNVSPFRELNRCHVCNHPRGVDTEPRCPECGAAYAVPLEAA